MIDKAIEVARFDNKTEKLEQLIQIFEKKEQTKALAEELKKALGIVKSRKTAEQVSVGVVKYEPLVPETMSESLNGLWHRGRINKLTEIFANGYPDRKAFATVAKERLAEAEKFLNNESELKRITAEQRQEKIHDFLAELAKAAESHSPWDPLPVFKSVIEATKYLDTISH